MPRALAAAPRQLFAGFDNGRIYASQNGGDGSNALAIDGNHLSRIKALAAVIDAPPSA